MTARRYRAVIFDMDGVLTDSEPAFFAAVNDILARYGKRLTLEQYSQYIGMSTSAMWTRVIALTGAPLELEQVIKDYEAPLMARLREPRPPLQGAREIIARLRARAVPIALCTASYDRWCEAILGGAGLDGLFDVVSTADMVEHPKPAPDPYLLAASKLGVPPDECIAIEDSASGVTSALGAGMYVVQLRATSTAAPPVEGVHRVITSLDHFPMDLVR